MRVLHVVPSGDDIDHDTAIDDLDCMCGPRWARFSYDDDLGSGWAVVHACLDLGEPPDLQ